MSGDIAYQELPLYIYYKDKDGYEGLLKYVSCDDSNWHEVNKEYCKMLDGFHCVFMGTGTYTGKVTKLN
jgi:hypothetical protein